MYTIKNLNNLYKDILGFFKGESYIQEGVAFCVELKNKFICSFIESSDRINIYINDDLFYMIKFEDLEQKNSSLIIESFWKDILFKFSYTESISGIKLKNIYTGHHVFFTDEKKLIQVQYTEYISEKTGQPFLYINRITSLNHIKKEFIDQSSSKIFIEDDNDGKIDKYEFFLI